MSDTASTVSIAGSTSDTSGVELPRVSHRSLGLRLAAHGVSTALTKENLKKNNSVLANRKRLFEAPEKVVSIATAFRDAFNDKLPEKAKRQLLEEQSGVSPMQRFLKTEDDIVGGPVDVEFWDDLTRNDPMAAELDSLQLA